MNTPAIRPPVTFEVDRQWGGFAMDRVRPNETGRMEVVGFHSFDEGIPFYKLVDNFNGLAHRAGVLPSMVDRMLVILEPRRTTLYMNDMIEISLLVRARRRIKAFEPVGMKDFAGIERVALHNVTVPKNAGFILLLSHFWRKAFFFDFRPLLPDQPVPIDCDVEVVGGQLLSHLVYTEYFLLSDAQWDVTIAAGWFPFMHLVGDLWDSLLHSIRNGEDLTYAESQIYDSFAKVLDTKVDDWIKKSILRDEEPFLSRAVDAFKKKDWVTVISLISPRIEGIIRRSLGSYGKHDKMVADLENTITAAVPHDRSLLFPKQLARYFRQTFLQFVDFSASSGTLNRHTVAHGMVPGKSIDQSHGLRIMLLLDHLYYCLPTSSSTEQEDAAEPGFGSMTVEGSAAPAR